MYSCTFGGGGGGGRGCLYFIGVTVLVGLACESPHVCNMHIWRCKHARFYVEDIYIYILCVISIFIHSSCEQVLFVRFYNNPAPLNGSMQFHYCTLVTREPEQTTLLF